MTDAARRLPDIADPLMAPFWQAARNHLLVVQKCEDCGELRFPPLPVCSNCWSRRQSWVEIAPTGTVWSYVVYHRALDQSFADEVPYAIGRVKSDAGPHFTVRLDVPLKEIDVAMPVVASWLKVSPDITLLQYTRPTDAGNGTAEAHSGIKIRQSQVGSGHEVARG